MLPLWFVVVCFARAQGTEGAQGPEDTTSTNGEAELDAAEGEPQGAAKPTSLTARERLREAVAAYQTGRRDVAQLELNRLIDDPDVDPAVRQEARVYLGEFLFFEGDVPGARRMFEQVVRENPDYVIDPFRHPPEVLTQFNVARSGVVPIEDDDPPVATTFPALPTSGYLGFGFYQLRHGKAGKGSFFLLSQGVIGAVSLTTFGMLLADRDYYPGTPEEQRIKTLRNVQWGSTAVFWGIHLTSLLDAQRHWRLEGANARGSNREARLSVQLRGRW